MESIDLKNFKKAPRKYIIKTIIAISAALGSISLVQPAPVQACAGGHLDRYQVGSSLIEIINGMSGACPSSITLNAGMNGFAVCEEARMSGKTIFLIGDGKRVTAVRKGPSSYGNYCAW